MNKMEKSKITTILEIEPVKQNKARIWESSPLAIKQIKLLRTYCLKFQKKLS